MNIELSSNLTEVLKWVALVFAAGFIGYFGRFLGMLIIERMRQKRQGSPEQTPPVASAEERAAGRENKSEVDELKLQKKMVKLEKKKAKKE